VRWAVIRDPRFRRPEAGGRNPEAAAAVENGQTLGYAVPVKVEAGKVTETVKVINWEKPFCCSKKWKTA